MFNFFQIFEILIQFGSKITHLAPENSEQAPGDLMTVEKQNEEGTQPQSVHSTFDTTLKTWYVVGVLGPKIAKIAIFESL